MRNENLQGEKYKIDISVKVAYHMVCISEVNNLWSTGCNVTCCLAFVNKVLSEHSHTYIVNALSVASLMLQCRN